MRVRARLLPARGGEDAPDVDIDVVSLSLKEDAPTGFPQGTMCIFLHRPFSSTLQFSNSDAFGFEEDSMTVSTGEKNIAKIDFHTSRSSLFR